MFLVLKQWASKILTLLLQIIVSKFLKGFESASNKEASRCTWLFGFIVVFG